MQDVSIPKQQTPPKTHKAHREETTVSSFGVVLDACVLIPATLRDTLLRAVEKGMYRLHWSDEILDEVRRNLVKREMTSPEDAQDLTPANGSVFCRSQCTGV